jgi:AcrR family transcriptional regulator
MMSAMAPARATYHHGDLPRVLRETARALVSEHGSEGFSLRAAAKQAGVDPAAVYRHYADKQALLRAIAREGFVELAAAMEASLARRRTPESRLIAVGEAYVRFAVAEPELFFLMFGRSGVATSDVEAEAPGGRSPYKILLDCLVELEAAGKSELPAQRASLGAWSAVHGLAHLVIEGRIEDVELGIREVTRSVLRSLRG